MMSRRFLLRAAAGLLLVAATIGNKVQAAEGAVIPSQNWSFAGMFGTFDRAAAQRGLQVYLEVCAGCHGLQYVAYRNLGALGFNADEVKAIAAEYEVTDGPDEDGAMFQRPAKPADRFVSPYANVNEARATNNGALPPDLTLMVKARKGGADYLYALLTGYEEEAPEGVTLQDGMNYNHYFPGNQIAMPPPLLEDGVTYADKTPATIDQMARDVTTFLAWAAEPELEERKAMGWKVMIFLVILFGLTYAVKRQVWSDVH